jgi:hypothetical protein
MKITVKTQGILVALLLSAFAGTSRANFSGSDDFNDNSEDTTKWTVPDIGNGGAVLTETNQHLEYSPSNSGATSALRPWKLNLGSYTADWTVQADVNLSSLSLASGAYVKIGVGVAKTSNFTQDNLDIGLEQSNGTNPGNHRYFDRNLNTNGSNVDIQTADVATTSAAVLIAYTAATHTITVSYDADGATGGYNWTAFNSTDITAAGSNWGMTASDTFSAVVVGNSNGITYSVGSNLASVDNFAASSVPEPSTYAMLAMGVAALLFQVRRRKQVRA